MCRVWVDTSDVMWGLKCAGYGSIQAMLCGDSSVQGMGRYKQCYVGTQVCRVWVDTSNVMWGLKCVWVDTSGVMWGLKCAGYG